MRISREQMFFEIAKIVSLRSTCLRKQVGAVIEKKGRVVSIGYNGVVGGEAHCSELECEGAGCNKSVHAEMNAIAFAAREGVSLKGSTLYVTLSPCINCAKIIVNSGIKEVKYLEKYRDVEGIEFLRRLLK